MTQESQQAATLTSLAMLKVRADARDRQDYIDYLKPFGVYVLAENKCYPVSREQLQVLLLSEFGLKVPVRGCELILKRLTRSGHLVKSQGIYSLKKDLPPSGIQERRVDAMRRGNSVVTQLSEFARTEYGIEYGTSQATKAFLSFISVFAIPCLSSYANGTALPTISDKNRKDIPLVAAFIKVAESNDLELFKDIILLVKGNMLANALLCEDLESQQQKFKQVTFFLDTPILLDILGVHGKRELNAATELLLSVTKLSGKFATFEHIVDETEKVLTHCESNIENPRVTNRVLSHVRENGLGRSDVAIILNNLRDHLEGCGIHVQRTPKYEVPYQIDENSLQAVLEARSKYHNPNARDTDINSVRSIYVLRTNKRPRSLEAAIAVLVTPNWRFAKESYRFGQQYEESKGVSPVITEFSLGNIAWLKSPLETDNLPRLELMASCYAIMEPSSEFWEKFLLEVEKLKDAGRLSSDDHAFLRSDYRVPNELMEMTLGSEDDLTEGTILEIKNRVVEALTREKDAELRHKDKELELETNRRKKLLLQHRRATSKINTIGVICGRIVAGIAGLLVCALLIVGLLAPFFKTESISIDKPWVFFFGAAILSIMTILNLILGVTLKRIYSWISGGSAIWVSSLLSRVLGLRDPEGT